MVRQNHTLAVVSLVVSLVGWFMCPIVGGVVGIITGMMAKKEIKMAPDRWDGMGLATAGIIISAIHIGLCVLVTALYVILIVIVGIGATMH